MYPSPESSKARVTSAMIVASRSPVAAAAAAASSAAARRCPLLSQHQVVRQPRQKPCPGDLADAAQLKRPPILLHPPLGAVLGVRREPETDLGLYFGRCRLRERRDGQFFGLAVAAGPVEPLHRLADQ